MQSSEDSFGASEFDCASRSHADIGIFAGTVSSLAFCFVRRRCTNTPRSKIRATKAIGHNGPSNFSLRATNTCYGLIVRRESHGESSSPADLTQGFTFLISCSDACDACEGSAWPMNTRSMVLLLVNRFLTDPTKKA